MKDANVKEVKESFRTVYRSINKNNEITLSKTEHSEQVSRKKNPSCHQYTLCWATSPKRISENMLPGQFKTSLENTLTYAP